MKKIGARKGAKKLSEQGPIFSQIFVKLCISCIRFYIKDSVGRKIDLNKTMKGSIVARMCNTTLLNFYLSLRLHLY